MTKDEVKKLRMNSPESLQFLNNRSEEHTSELQSQIASRMPSSA